RKRSATSASPAAGTATGGKAIYARQTSSAAPEAGLEELGEIIASSGLGSSHLRNPSSAASAPPASAARRPLPMAWMGGGAAVIVVGAVLLFMLFSGNEPAGPLDAGPGGGGTQANGSARTLTPTPAQVTGPRFAGVPLRGKTVVYLIDRGSAARESFADMKAATLASLRTLSATQSFQIIFWDNGQIDTIPADGPTRLTSQSIEQTSDALADIFA